MKYILEPAVNTELAFCNGCGQYYCESWSDDSGSFSFEIKITPKNK